MEYPKYTLELRQQGQELILEFLKSGAKNVDELIAFLEAQKLPYPQRIAKEAAWSLSEEGLARFNYNWMLQLTTEGWSAILRGVEQREIKKMSWMSKAEWTQSLQPGDKVLTSYRPLTEQYDGFENPPLMSATVEYIFTGTFTRSTLAVKLKEFPYELDIFWIQPYSEESLKQYNQMQAKSPNH